MLTPLDIESKTFSKSISGYNMQEVKQFISDIVVNYEKIYRENIELKDKVNVLNEGIQYYKTIESTLQNTLVLAEKTAEETKVAARKAAEQIEKEAKLKASVIINDAKNEVYQIKKQREELIKHFESSKIQLQQYLKAQLEMTENNKLEIKSIETNNSTLLSNVADETIKQVATTKDNSND
jgi:cell division initiation protein